MEEFLHHLGELASDPAHLAFEVLTTAVIEGLILGLFWPFIKRHIHRDLMIEHRRLEDEHNLQHPATQHDGYIERYYPDPHEPYDHERSSL